MVMYVDDGDYDANTDELRKRHCDDNFMIAVVFVVLYPVLLIWTAYEKIRTLLHRLFQRR